MCGFATQLQCGGDQLVSSGLGYAHADFGRAGEGQLAQAGVIQQILAGFRALAGDNVKDARRQDAVNKAGQLQYAQRGIAGGLKHSAAACAQNRSQLPGSHQEGEIPGDDLPDNTNRLF